MSDICMKIDHGVNPSIHASSVRVVMSSKEITRLFLYEEDILLMFSNSSFRESLIFSIFHCHKTDLGNYYFSPLASMKCKVS